MKQEYRSPSFEEAMNMNSDDVPKLGLHMFEGGFGCWNAETTAGAHDIPDGFSILTLRELLELRARLLLEELPEKSKVSFCTTKTKSLSDIIEKNRTKLLPFVASPILQRRFKTRTVWYHALNDMFQIIDISDARFRNPCFDYANISDGGARVLHPFEEQPYAEMSWGDYLLDRGGDMPLKRWYSHRLVKALEPDEDARKRYLIAMSLLKKIRRDGPLDSLWAPREMSPGYVRGIDSGRDAVALYPPNATTVGHSVLFKK